MKIIYLHQYFNTPEMSGGTRSYEMARRMVAAGHEVHMITSSREKSNKNTNWYTTDEAGINIYWYPVPYSNQMSYLQRIKAFFSFAFAAKKKAMELEADLIFATSTPLTISLPAVPVSRKKKIPMVFEVRDLWPEMPIAMGALKNPILRFSARQLEKWSYKNSTAIVALSPGMKEGIVRTGYPAQQVAVIPNSSDNVEFQYDAIADRSFRDERGWLGDKPLLVYAGTLGKVNGVEYMVKLAKELLKMQSDIRILVVGSGGERTNIIEEAKTVGVLENNLFFEQSISKKQMPALLSTATMASNLVIDLPEARANSANKFFDTLAAGKPILLNHGGWMHNLVNKHGCGLAMHGKSIHEVAIELDKKMHDKDWLTQAGKASRKLAETSFDRDLLAEQLISVLEAALAGNPQKSAAIAPGNYY